MIGKTISHYKIIEKLGEGGMGKVYRAEDLTLKREVALKFLPKEFCRDPNAKKRLISEARSASLLDHNNICVIHEISETDDGQLFISMNYYKGDTLQKKLLEEQLSIKNILKYIIQIAKGLEKAHSMDIVHCDIKPGNILITNDGIAKIVDFGIAKVCCQENLISPDRTPGTIAYMSPEQISNSNIDQRTDIWSLGVIFYEMMTNQIPFQDSYDQAVMYSIINEEPKTITAINSDIPIELEQIVNKMLKKNPDDRYQQVSDLLKDLKNYKKNKDIPAVPLKILKSIYGTKNRSWSYLITSFLLIAIVLSIAYYAIFRTHHVPSIGIMNMENLGDSEDDFWSRGITEDLIINVASAGVIRVPTINEVNKYKRSEFSMAEIAEKLRVDYLLFSSFFKADSVFDLWCRIIDPKSGKDIFAKKWTKPVKNASSITTILAGIVLNNLGISSKKSAKVPVIVDPDAYELYLRGKHVWETRKNQSDNNLARGLLNKALEKDPNFMQAKIQLGKMYYGLADYNQAFEIFHDCLEYAKDINDESTIALAMLNIGNTHLVLYQVEEAIKNYKTALRIVRKHGDKYNEGKLLRNLGSSYYWKGNNKKTQEYFLESSILSAELGDVQGEGETLYNLGILLLEARDYGSAMNSYKNSFDIFEKIENKSHMGSSLLGISYSYMGLGKIESALSYAEASLQNAHEIYDKRNELNSSAYIGEINYDIGNDEVALDIFLKSSELAYNINDTYYLGVSFQYLGQLMVRNGNYEKSFKYFALADSVWIKLDDPTHRVWTQAAWALAALKFGDKKTAAIKSLKSESILKDTKPYEDYASCVYYDLYNYYITVGDTSLAKKYLSNAHNELLNRLKYIDDSKNKDDFLNRIVEYSAIIKSYEEYY